MDVSNMLASDQSQSAPPSLSTKIAGDSDSAHIYPTRQSQGLGSTDYQHIGAQPMYENHPNSMAAPSSTPHKNVTFELHFDGTSNVRGRLPMRVQIFPHDTTESIVTTVKNFYGLYDSGVSFEDVDGNTLIASFDNLVNNMTVYVRVGPDLPQAAEYPEPWGYRATSPQRMYPATDVSHMMPPQPAQALTYGQPPSRPGSRISRKQSASPKLSQARIGSNTKSRSRSGVKSQGSSFQAGLDELNTDTQNGYSSSDGGGGASVTSSRRARSELLATADISVDNIVEGGRRQKAKFESSELPLFVPPQVPAPNSISSISPQRRSNGLDNPSPFARPLQRTFSFQTMEHPNSSFTPNPQVASAPPIASPFTVPTVPNHGHRLRERASGASLYTRSSLGSSGRFNGSNILPTPDPTVASCISDEDVALQLMRLGDASNFSHGRTSASTLDDAFSGRAEAASSATSNLEYSADESDASTRPHVKEEPELLGPPLKKQRRSFGEHYNGDDYAGDYDKTDKARPKLGKTKKSRPGALSMRSSRPMKIQGVPKKAKSMSSAMTPHQPISPGSFPPSRKTSTSTINFQHQLGADEDDLSSKPRCQRCRKSKKGCDRQRPCQRCKDAGIGIEGCVSEDEGNGRKGRYGRHMGVPVSIVYGGPSDDNNKTDNNNNVDDNNNNDNTALEPSDNGYTAMVVDGNDLDKSKKRKR